jgi:hypothetical protein
MDEGAESIVFQWLERIGLKDAVPSFRARGIVTPKVRLRSAERAVGALERPPIPPGRPLAAVLRPMERICCAGAHGLAV